MGEEVKNEDLNIFVNCTPLFDDIEWEPQLVDRRVAMGLQSRTPRNDNPLLSQEQCPPLLMVAEQETQAAPEPLQPAENSGVNEQLSQAAPEPLQATENSGVNESTINISSPNASEPVEVGRKRKVVGQKRRPGRPKSKNDDPPSWLPPNWTVRTQIRQRGASAGHVDKVNECSYIDRI
ncbi:hypothetical protein Pint_32379 [Pistacia integerrima]|uniref:Uncharacterized protein n=1 Tax=Pistacia integerrima TaxID=434235 RepID=A0ACC0XQ60_9ROSI|nr:hypothetical protein Pint_32379 [Pistacia integerrima]